MKEVTNFGTKSTPTSETNNTAIIFKIYLISCIFIFDRLLLHHIIFGVNQAIESTLKVLLMKMLPITKKPTLNIATLNPTRKVQQNWGLYIQSVNIILGFLCLKYNRK